MSVSQSAPTSASDTEDPERQSPTGRHSTVTAARVPVPTLPGLGNVISALVSALSVDPEYASQQADGPNHQSDTAPPKLQPASLPKSTDSPSSAGSATSSIPVAYVEGDPVFLDPANTARLIIGTKTVAMSSLMTVDGHTWYLGSDCILLMDSTNGAPLSTMIFTALPPAQQYPSGETTSSNYITHTAAPVATVGTQAIVTGPQGLNIAIVGSSTLIPGNAITIDGAVASLSSGVLFVSEADGSGSIRRYTLSTTGGTDSSHEIRSSFVIGPTAQNTPLASAAAFEAAEESRENTVSKASSTSSGQGGSDAGESKTRGNDAEQSLIPSRASSQAPRAEIAVISIIAYLLNLASL